MSKLGSMFYLLKEKLKIYFINPLKLFFFGRVSADKFGQSNYWMILASVLVIVIFGLVLARFFLNLATVDLPANDNSLIGQFKTQAQKFIYFAANNSVPPDRQAERQAEKIRAEKEAVLQAKLAQQEKFSRVTFFYTAPYLGSVAIPAIWEKKYRTEEKNNTIDFFYTPMAGEEYPLFQIGILSREEWEKKRLESDKLAVLAIVSNFVFFDQIYTIKINNPVKQEDYNGMQKQVKSVLDSFKSYKQE